MGDDTTSSSARARGAGGGRAAEWSRALPVRLPLLRAWFDVARRKKEAREAHRRSQFAQRVHGLRAKLYNQKRFKEKVAMKKTCVRALQSELC